MNTFTKINKELRNQIQIWEPKLLDLTEETYMHRLNVQSRSIKQILGHMIDSASNNTHRIVHLQYRKSPLIFPNYATYGNNDRWIAIQNYQYYQWEELVQLWKYTNRHIAFIIQNIDSEKLQNSWEADKNKYITLEEMVLDFPRHFKLHLKEIDELIGSGSEVL